MEQPNNVMPNGVPPQNKNMNTMQRPQPGNVQQQIHAKIMQNLRNKTSSVPLGWQQIFDIGQRGQRIMQLTTMLRILDSDIMTCISTAEQFELRTLNDSVSKEEYQAKFDAKFAEITARRQELAMQGRQQMGLSMNMASMNNMQNSNMGGMNNMQNLNMAMNMNMANGGMGMANAQMGGNGQQPQSFPTHLQRQMQPSPLPPQQQQQNTNTLDPSALQNPQAPFQMPNMNQPNPPPQQNMNVGDQNQYGGQPSQQQIFDWAKRTYATMPDDRKNSVRTQWMSQLTDQQRLHVTSYGDDPLMRLLLLRGPQAMRKQKLGQTGQPPQQNGGGMPMGNNMSMGGTNMQQTPSSQSGTSGFDFSSIMGQQQNAIKSAESGEQVVPASNNDSLNLAAQMNVPQSVDPQMLGNQSNQANANQQAQMQQFAAMQRDRQNRELMQKKNQMAQQQALAQQQAQTQNALRGQPGGLNTPNALNGGQVNSPAMNMNMLNRPMVPPGQKTPSTPQQNRPQGMPQTPVNGANQLAQHHQNMLNANGQQQMSQGGAQQNTMQQRMMMTLPQSVQDRLRGMPAESVDQILANFAAKQRSGQMQGMQNNNQQGQAVLPNVNLGGTQMNNQQQAMNGMPSGMGNAVPGFNSQPPPNQQLNQQPQGDQSMNFQQRMQQHQQAQLRQRAMDLRHFPKAVLGSLGVSVPDFTNEWGKLRLHINQNQSVLPLNTLQKFQAAQNQWFEAHPEELQAGMNLLRQQMHNAQQNKAAQQQQQQQQQQQPPGARPPSAMQMPNGQAPPAQMVPPTAPMQQPSNPGAGPNMNQGQPRLPPPQPPTVQEVQILREKLPNTQGMSDDEIRGMIMRRKIQSHQRNNSVMQASLRNAQMQQARNQAIGGQVANPSQGIQQQQQPQRPPQQAPNQQANAQGQGQKRASSDDVVEIPDPNAPPMGAPQAPAMQPSQSMQQLQQQPMPPAFAKMPTKEQLDQMDPQQRMMVMQKMQQMNALRKAQMDVVNTQNQSQPPNLPQPQPLAAAAAAGALQGPPTLEERQRIRGFMAEITAATKKGPAVQLDSKGMEQAQASLRRLWTPIQNIDRTFLTALRLFGEQRVKDALRAKLIFTQNAADANGGIQDYLAVRPAELKKLEAFVGSYFQELKTIKDRGGIANVKGPAQAAPPSQAGAVKAQQQAQQPSQDKQPAAKQQQPSKQQAPPLNHKASQPNQTRKASAAAAKAPPAPTEKKTFDWGTLSPHGVPKYDSASTGLTADKLNIPPHKRRRTGGGQSGDSQGQTPASQIGTPGAVASPVVAGTKALSPEQARKLQVKQEQPQEPIQPKFRCDDPLCDASVRGFDSEELLKQHKESVHQPIADPLGFLLDSAATALGVDKNGMPLRTKTETKAPAQPRGRQPAATRPGLKKESQTPSIKQEGATPATPASSGKAAVKSGATSAGRKAIDAKVPDSAVDVPEKEKTLMEAMADKIGFEMPSATKVPEVSIESAHDAWVDLLQNQLSGVNASVDDWSQFSKVTDWGLRPELESSPDLTPSDQTSQSSRESDISQSERLRINFEWDAFGNGATGVPEALMMQGLGLEETLGAGEDMLMEGAEGGAEKKDGEDEQWNWSNDMTDWDAMFGPNAGLEGDWVDTANAGMVF